jgi:hypothetical protein
MSQKIAFPRGMATGNFLAARPLLGLFLLVLVFAAVLATTACNNLQAMGSPASTGTNQNPALQVVVTPSSATVSSERSLQFTAQVKNSSSTGVVWSASIGSITPEGLFHAPKVTTQQSVTVVAASAANPAVRATASATIIPVQALQIATSSLSPGTKGRSFSNALSASGGISPYIWSVGSGQLPPGLLLSPSTGVISGVPSQTGTFSFAVALNDASNERTTKSMTLAVSSPTTTTGNFDGPAELPRVYLQTALAYTPAPGQTITVKAGDNLQAALNKVNCGDTVQLQAGATFLAKGSSEFVLPARSCDDQHWIIIRTSTPDASLPPPGTRMTPCFAGVASLPGRPVYPCPKPQQLLATISYPTMADGPITFANGANHYRLIGLEITRVANNRQQVTQLIGPEVGGAMDHIVLDRLYIHGTPRDETRRGVFLSGGTNVSVQDSYLSDFHCNSRVGACVDSQAIAGGSGSLPMGPFKIVNNFLEAAAENILFGGSRASQTPADIEIRFNHLFKPMFWMPGQPGFSEPAFIVKNSFELKNAQRVLFDSNLLEGSWGGFSQDGFSVVITPVSQPSSDLPSGVMGLCPLCQVTDVTIRNIFISHVGGGFEIANPFNKPNGVAARGERYSIHDVIIDDMNGLKYNGRGTFAQVSTIPSPLLQDVVINHVTAFPPRVLFNVGATIPLKMTDFNFTNSIITAGELPLSTTGDGRGPNCADPDVPLKVMINCFSGSLFSSNAVLASPAKYPPSSWPGGNYFYNSPASIGFVNFNNGNGGDYHLLPTSPAKGKASDGLDLGANAEAVYAAISTVR